MLFPCKTHHLLSPTVSTLFFHALACRLMGTGDFMQNTLAFVPKSARALNEIVLDLIIARSCENAFPLLSAG